MIWHRRRMIWGVGLILCAATIGFLGWWFRDPNPPARLTIPNPGRGAVQGAGLGFSLNNRSYSLNGAAGTSTYDLDTGHATIRPTDLAIFLRVFSPDRQRFAGWSIADQAVVWGDTATAEVRGKFPFKCSGNTTLPHLGWVEGNSQIQMVTCDPLHVPADHVISTWDITTGVGTQRTVLGPRPTFQRPQAIAPDGRTWVYLDTLHNGLQFWDSVADQPIGNVLRVPTTWRNLDVQILDSPTLNPSGSTMIVSVADGRIECWALTTGRMTRQLRVLPAGYHVNQNLRLSPDGRLLAVTGYANDPTDWLGWTWDLIRRKLTGKSMSQDSAQLVIVDLATGQPLATYRKTWFGEWSHDGRLFSTQDADNTTAVRVTPVFNQP